MLVADREMAAAHPEVVGGAGARRSRHFNVDNHLVFDAC